MESEIRAFHLQWIAVTIAGYAVAILLLLPFAVSIAYTARSPLLIGLASGAVLGAMIGIGQWIILRRGSIISPFWIGASIAGGMIGMALGMSVESYADPITALDATREAASLVIPWSVAWQTSIAGALFGLGLGIGQYWCLRQFVRSAYWWIFANGAAWMVGLGVGAAIAPFVTTLVALLITGLVAATITAYVMEPWQWEIHKRTKPIPGRHSF